jgi:excisionase family DNA binding protein
MSHEHLLKFPEDEVDPQGFVSVNRAAKLLDVSPTTIYGWIQSGKLPAYRLGRNVRLKTNEFLRWVDIHARQS